MSVAFDLTVGEWTPQRLSTFLAEPSNEDLDWRRFEIVDGALIVSPSPGRPHEAIVSRLIRALGPGLPVGFDVVGSVSVGVGRSYRVTDVTVLSERAISSPTPTLDGADVLLAVEVESASSITTDRITKPAQYAQAGIAYYWRVENDPLRLVTYALDGDAYVETGAWGVDETAHVTGPFDVTIDLATLLP